MRGLTKLTLFELLSFFRFNDPYRLVFIFLLLLAIRIPVFFSDDALTTSDLHYMVIGEKMSAGYGLYTEIWDNIAPLAAGVYWFIDIIFGRSLLSYQIISLLLVTLQAALFNRLILNNKALNENSYGPALVYAVCMSLFFDFFTLTPILMSLTFILLALNHLFDHIEIRAKRDEQIFSIGLYLGVASLFYLPIILLAPATLLILALFTGTVFRRYLLLSFGVALPFLLLIGYYLLNDGVRDFYYNFFNPYLQFGGSSSIGFISLVIIILVPSLFTILGFGKVIQGTRFTNYQMRLTQVMFIWLLISIILMFFGAPLTPSKFMILVPSVAFFVSHYFLSFKRGLKSEIFFGIFFVSIYLVAIGTIFNFFFTSKYIEYDKMLVQETRYDKIVKNKTVLVLGEMTDIYKNSSLATPYLNWELSKPLFESLEYYDNVVTIHKNFKIDSPQIVIDPHHFMDDLFEYIPWIEKSYSKSSDGVYVLNN